ncbi:MAG: zinc ribbon domain-containing protein [Patescibacteria group bacterium]
MKISELKTIALLDDEERFCPDCGEEIEEGVCPKCGSAKELDKESLDEEEEVAE